MDLESEDDYKTRVQKLEEEAATWKEQIEVYRTRALQLQDIVTKQEEGEDALKSYTEELQEELREEKKKRMETEVKIKHLENMLAFKLEPPKRSYGRGIASTSMSTPKWHDKSDEHVQQSNQQQQNKVFVMRETRKLPNFGGKPTKPEDPDVQEWIEDMREHTESSSLSIMEQCTFITDHLKGDAKSEVRFRPYHERDTPEKILDIIQHTFGVRESSSQLFEQFFKSNQTEKQNIFEYSLTLMKLYERIIKRNPECERDKEKVLKERFAEGVKDDNLRRELRRLNLDQPSLEFWEVRERAQKWYGTEDDNGKKTKECSSVKCKVQHAKTNEMEEFKKMVKDELKHMQEMITNLTTRKTGFCYGCGSPDHFLNTCPNRRNTDKKRAQNSVKSQLNKKDL